MDLNTLQDVGLVAATGTAMYPVIKMAKNLPLVKGFFQKKPHYIPYATMGLGVIISFCISFMTGDYTQEYLEIVASGVSAGLVAGGLHGTVRAHKKAASVEK
jgi:hypothetical protein